MNTDYHRQKLSELADWKPYLLSNSGLPGPRGNLELAAAVAQTASSTQIAELIKEDDLHPPENTPEMYLVFCGLFGLGRLVAEGQKEHLATIQRYASDPRWRLREGVAMALQTWGNADTTALMDEMQTWAQGSWWEKRAAAAAMCEPRLLKDAHIAERLLNMLDGITAALAGETNRKDKGWQTLKKSMGYCWSVAAAANPAAGLPLMEKWLTSPDPVIRKILVENLKKNRMQHAAPEWTERWLST